MVLDEIRKSKREGVRVLKIIHGYGSSGKGGTLNHQSDLVHEFTGNLRTICQALRRWSLLQAANRTDGVAAA